MPLRINSDDVGNPTETKTTNLTSAGKAFHKELMSQRRKKLLFLENAGAPRSEIESLLQKFHSNITLLRFESGPNKPISYLYNEMVSQFFDSLDSNGFKKRYPLCNAEEAKATFMLNCNDEDGNAAVIVPVVYEYQPIYKKYAPEIVGIVDYNEMPYNNKLKTSTKAAESFMIVAEKYRGQGYGAALAAARKADMLENGYVNVVGNVLHTNTEQQARLLKSGWKIDESQSTESTYYFKKKLK